MSESLSKDKELWTSSWAGISFPVPQWEIFLLLHEIPGGMEDSGWLSFPILTCSFLSGSPPMKDLFDILMENRVACSSNWANWSTTAFCSLLRVEYAPNPLNSAVGELVNPMPPFKHMLWGPKYYLGMDCLVDNQSIKFIFRCMQLWARYLGLGKSPWLVEAKILRKVYEFINKCVVYSIHSFYVSP